MLVSRLVLCLSLLLAAAGCDHSTREVIRCYQSGEMVCARYGVQFFARDVLAQPGQGVELQARVLTPRSFAGIPGVEVTFYDGMRALGSAVTDDRGCARLAWRAPADTGPCRLTAQPTSLPSGRDMDKRILEMQADLLVDVRPPDTEFIIVDLDDTVVDDSFANVLTRPDPRCKEEAPRVLKRISQQMGVIYLTHRPDVLTRKSKQWLADNGLPPGVLITCGVGESLRDNAAVKAAKLASVRESFGLVRFGVGDLLSDCRAYVDSGARAVLIVNQRLDGGKLRELAAALRSEPRRDRIQVVTCWSEVQRAVLYGEDFPAEAGAQKIEKMAEGK